MRVLVLALLEEVERPFGFQLQAREQISTVKTIDALIWILINAKNLQNKSFIAPFSSLYAPDSKSELKFYSSGKTSATSGRRVDSYWCDSNAWRQGAFVRS